MTVPAGEYFAALPTRLDTTRSTACTEPATPRPGTRLVHHLVVGGQVGLLVEDAGHDLAEVQHRVGRHHPGPALQSREVQQVLDQGAEALGIAVDLLGVHAGLLGAEACPSWWPGAGRSRRWRRPVSAARARRSPGTPSSARPPTSSGPAGRVAGRRSPRSPAPRSGPRWRRRARSGRGRPGRGRRPPGAWPPSARPGPGSGTASRRPGAAAGSTEEAGTAAGATPQAKNCRSPVGVGAPNDSPWRPRAAASSLVRAGSRSARSRLCWATVASAAVVALASCSRTSSCWLRRERSSRRTSQPAAASAGDEDAEGEQPRQRRHRGDGRPEGQRPHLHGPGLQLHGVRRLARRSRAGEGLDRPVRPGERDPAPRGPQRRSASASGRAARPGARSRARGAPRPWPAGTRCRRSRPPRARRPSPRAPGCPSPARGWRRQPRRRPWCCPRRRPASPLASGPGGGLAQRTCASRRRPGRRRRRPRPAPRARPSAPRLVTGDRAARRRLPAGRPPRWRPAPPTSSGPAAARSRLEHRRPQRAEVSLREERHADPRGASPQLHPSGSCCRSRRAGPGRRSPSRSASSSPVIPGGIR